MPYENQFGSKTAHSDVVRNPDVQAFLQDGNPLRVPSDEELQRIVNLFSEVQFSENPPDTKFIIASDGSPYHSTIDDRFPSVRVTYLKFSTLLIEMNDFHGLEDSETNLVDPFRVAALQQNRDTLSLVLPLCNFRLPNEDSVRSTFRRQTEEFLKSEATQFRKGDQSTSLLATLIELAQLREGSSERANHIRIHRCPNDDCESSDRYLDLTARTWNCDDCGIELYISDCMRIWEGVDDFHANQEPSQRFMSYIEHLLPVHYVRHIRNESPTELGCLALMVDGPLAVFGNAAWLHTCIMRFYSDLRNQQFARSLLPPLVIGLQKTGYVVDFMSHLREHIDGTKVFCVTDDFRYANLGVKRSGNGFGAETYYGQDFVLKTTDGKLFVFGLPYPFGQKAATPNFLIEKCNSANYPELSRAVALIDLLSTDLYRDAVIPVALAHRYTAISLKPGGRVLDVMGRQSTAGRR